MGRAFHILFYLDQNQIRNVIKFKEAFGLMVSCGWPLKLENLINQLNWSIGPEIKEINLIWYWI